MQQVTLSYHCEAGTDSGLGFGLSPAFPCLQTELD